jgi:hypothetical protein
MLGMCTQAGGTPPAPRSRVQISNFSTMKMFLRDETRGVVERDVIFWPSDDNTV